MLSLKIEQSIATWMKIKGLTNHDYNQNFMNYSTFVLTHGKNPSLKRARSLEELNLAKRANNRTRRLNQSLTYLNQDMYLDEEFSFFEFFS